MTCLRKVGMVTTTLLTMWKQYEFFHRGPDDNDDGMVDWHIHQGELVHIRKADQKEPARRQGTVNRGKRGSHQGSYQGIGQKIPERGSIYA